MANSIEFKSCSDLQAVLPVFSPRVKAPYVLPEFGVSKYLFVSFLRDTVRLDKLLQQDARQDTS